MKKKEKWERNFFLQYNNNCRREKNNEDEKMEEKVKEDIQDLGRSKRGESLIKINNKEESEGKDKERLFHSKKKICTR